MLKRPRLTDNQALALILLLALLLRLLLWSGPLHDPANDEMEYITVARDLLAGRGWVFYESWRWLRAPLYPLWLAGSLWLAGGDLHRAALPNVLLSVANVWLVAQLAGAIIGRRARLPAALLVTLLWTNVTFASLYMLETLFTFCFSAALLVLFARRVSWWSAALAGVLFGLAMLTRSAAMLFLPVVALWLLVRHWQATNRRITPSLLLAPAALVLAAALVVAPWTWHNLRAYGAPILIETGLSYNLWVFSEPLESRDTIHTTLQGIRNPAERSGYATAKGVERLRDDPGILARKLWPNWVYFWRVKPIQDRFLQASYYADIPLPLFVAALVFDDLLYLGMLVAGVIGAFGRIWSWWQGRASSRGRRDGVLSLASTPEALCIAWGVYVVATVLVTHGEARYRHFVFPTLIPFAAWTLLHLRDRAVSLRQVRWLAFGAAALCAALLWTIVPSYPWDWAGTNLVRGWFVQGGNLARATGNMSLAQRWYRQAAVAAPSPDAWIHLGDALRADGKLTEAINAYGNARDLAPPYPLGAALFGDSLREDGNVNKARAAFRGEYADAQQVVDVAWERLDPQPIGTVEVGDGLDFGYVGGVYPPERLLGSRARWTNGHAQVRLANSGTGSSIVMLLRVAAPWPDGTQPDVQVCIAATCRAVAVAAELRTYAVVLPRPVGTVATVQISSPTFAAADGRLLGVVLDTAALRGK